MSGSTSKPCLRSHRVRKRSADTPEAQQAIQKLPFRIETAGQRRREQEREWGGGGSGHAPRRESARASNLAQCHTALPYMLL